MNGLLINSSQNTKHPFRYFFLIFTFGMVTMFAQSCSLDGRTEYAPPLESDLGSTIGEEKIVRISPNAQARAAAGDKVKVIVGIKTGFTPPGHLTAEAEAAQEAAIARDQDTVLNSLGGADHSHVKKYQFIPYMALSVNQNALNGLSRHPMVGSVTEDMAVQANLAQSVPLIQGDLAWNAGFTGAGQTVAILDTGVSKTHPFLSGKVVSEACYSYHDIANGYATTCPNGSQAQVGAGSGVNCNLAYGGCDHGTHVAGIAAGNGGSFSGVAKLATVIAIQVFTYDIWYGYVVAFNSDIIAGLNRAYALRGTYNISSVNLSLGGGLYSTYCDAADGGAFKAAADALSSANIATVVASGNESNSTKISWPACVSTSISVGATSKADAVASFSNSASILKLLAPGVSINSSIPGGGYAAWSGTSMAAPHVAGAWALYKHANPTATVAQVLAAFQANGTGILDTRNGITKPRINILNSLRSTLNVTVAGVRGGSGTVTGTGISCPGTCTGTYIAGTSITLTAAPGGGSIFTGWGGGACSGMATTCTISLNGVVNVTAMFATPPVAKIDGDFDGDNKGDIFWRNYGSGVNFIWHMNGATLLGSAAVNTLHTNWLMVGVGDFDGDGNHDLLWRNKVTGANAIWFMNGVTLISGVQITPLSVASGYQVVAVGDLNGDGLADIVWRNYKNGGNAVWFMNGANILSWSSIRTISLSSGWDIVGAGDTDADGKADLIVRNAPSNQLGVWYMEGSLLKGSALLTNLGPSWTVEGMSDLDGDGNSDILFRNYYNGENAVWYMSGGAVSGGTLITPSVASTYWQIGNN